MNSATGSASPNGPSDGPRDPRGANPGIRSRPTRDGWIAGGLAFALTNLGAVSGNNLVVLVGCVGLAAVWVDLAAGRWNLRGIEVRWALPAELFAGVACRGAFLVRNTRARGALGRVSLDDGTARGSADGVPAGSEREVRAWWRFPRRGRFALDGIAVRSDWPFGMFQHVRAVPATAEGLVWPTPRDGRGHEIPAEGADGGRASQIDPAGEFRELRPYRPGDRLRDVHVRTSARVGQPMVVVRGSERAGGVLAVIPPDPDDEALGRATGVVLDAHARGVPVGVDLSGSPELARPGTGSRWRRRLLDALAVVGESP